VSELAIKIWRVRGARDADLPLPGRATPGSAGFDLCAALEKDLELLPGGRVDVPTGIALAIPPGYEGQVRPRSGLAGRYGVMLVNAPGTIDSDYRGELRVLLYNSGDQPLVIRRGDRVAQLVIAPVLPATWVEVASADELGASERGSGGFGHTGR
jgi:dUTP pyrophosphatase